MTVNITKGTSVALFPQHRFQRLQIHVALEGVDGLWLASFWDGDIETDCAYVLDIGAGGVEVGVVGHDIARFQDRCKENAFGSPTLVGGQNVLEAGDLLHGILETIEGSGSGIGFITHHHARPLPRGHGSGAGIGEQIDQHIPGLEQEKVVTGVLDGFDALFSGRLANLLHCFDAEGFDNGLELHVLAPLRG